MCRKAFFGTPYKFFKLSTFMYRELRLYLHYYKSIKSHTCCKFYKKISSLFTFKKHLILCNIQRLSLSIQCSQCLRWNSWGIVIQALESMAYNSGAISILLHYRQVKSQIIQLIWFHHNKGLNLRKDDLH